MKAKSLFYCEHCKENRYGDHEDIGLTTDKKFIAIRWTCSSCCKQTMEKLPAHNEKPEIPPDAKIY